MGFGDKLKQKLIDQKIKEEYWSVGDKINGLYEIVEIFSCDKKIYKILNPIFSAWSECDEKKINKMLNIVKQKRHTLGKVKKTMDDEEKYLNIGTFPKYVLVCRFFTVFKSASVSHAGQPIPPVETRYKLIGVGQVKDLISP